jgi:hypothetical protein
MATRWGSPARRAPSMWFSTRCSLAGRLIWFLTSSCTGDPRLPAGERQKLGHVP